ncbi:sulfite exporter TauE/SafE family protein [Neoroseomonas eburnea]
MGFVAQFVDGAIGMAGGVTASAFLLSAGVPPAVVSAGVHTAKIGTAIPSGLAHWRLGHVDMKLMRRLAVPGMIGGVAGALVASYLPVELLKPAVSIYLVVMGFAVLRRSWHPVERSDRHHATASVVGAGGGFLDGVVGGGWGPIVTSSLIAHGAEPRIAIGTCNAAEFFVAAIVSATFAATIGLGIWQVVVGLVIGGAVAAPFAALATRHIPERPLMAVVGLAILLLAGSALLRQFDLVG